MSFIRYSLAGILVLLSMSSYIYAEIMAIEPTSPYIPRNQMYLSAPFGYPAYSTPIRETPRFPTTEKIYRLNPYTGQMEWVENYGAVSVTQQ